MRKILFTICFLVGIATGAQAQQQFIGAGITTNVTSGHTRTGPYVEAQSKVGSNKLGTLTGHGLFLPEPAARLGLDFYPRAWRQEHIQPFIGAGHEWTRRTNGRVDSNPTLSAGLLCNKYLRFRATGLFGDADGVRVGADYLYPLKKRVALHAAVEGMWQERRPDSARFSFGVVRTW